MILLIIAALVHMAIILVIIRARREQKRYADNIKTVQTKTWSNKNVF